MLVGLCRRMCVSTVDSRGTTRTLFPTTLFFDTSMRTRVPFDATGFYFTEMRAGGLQRSGSCNKDFLSPKQAAKLLSKVLPVG
jgi:hypothetical protein